MPLQAVDDRGLYSLVSLWLGPVGLGGLRPARRLIQRRDIQEFQQPQAFGWEPDDRAISE